MMSAAVGHEENGAAPGHTGAARTEPSARILLRQRNRMLAVALASVAVAMLATVVILTMMFQYADAHHAIAAL